MENVNKGYLTDVGVMMKLIKFVDIFIRLSGMTLVLLLQGCSISDSAGSLSDSSGSIAKSSESISDSSTDDDKKDVQKQDSQYEDEVRDFTVTYMRTNVGRVDQDGFMEGISDIASQNGMVDWEASPKTYRAIGRGLRKANVISMKVINKNLPVATRVRWLIFRKVTVIRDKIVELQNIRLAVFAVFPGSQPGQ
jgi:hypothetical protein